MISLREFLRPGKLPGPTLADVERAEDDTPLSRKSTEVHKAAKDFEQTVKAFLEERQSQHKRAIRY